MTNLSSSSRQLIQLLSISPAEVLRVAALFCQAMVEGLAGEQSSLKMLPSYSAKATGCERGSCLALDFGGTNIRVQLVDLLGQGQWVIRKKTVVPLKDPAGRYDYTSAETDSTALFDFLASQIGGLADETKSYFLGHTFSFPCHQQGINQATLINWTKEIRTAGVEGREINGLLAQALDRHGLGQVKPCAIINDTVGTLLTASYSDPHANIGAICGTGHNSCYFDPGKAMIINMESGNFDILPCIAYDQLLDTHSERPGTQRLEKMAAGRYLGELVRLIVADLFHLSLAPRSLTAKDLAGILCGGGPRRTDLKKLSPEEVGLLQKTAQLAVIRSARLVAATFLGVLRYIDPDLKTEHTIAVDGSLYEKMPGYAEALSVALKEALGAKANMLTIRLSKDGSGVGAAIAAAIAGQEFGRVSER